MIASTSLFAQGFTKVTIRSFLFEDLLQYVGASDFHDDLIDQLLNCSDVALYYTYSEAFFKNAHYDAGHNIVTLNIGDALLRVILRAYGVFLFVPMSSFRKDWRPVSSIQFVTPITIAQLCASA